MEKKTYYVSVQAGTILENQGDASYEFEIKATEHEVEDLIESFELLSEVEGDTAVRGIIPGIPYHQDEANDNYDIVLTQVYRKLHTLGTEETRATIEQMGSIGEQDPPAQ